MKTTMNKPTDAEYHKLVLEFAIEQFGEAIENFYSKNEHLKGKTADHVLATKLFSEWENYLSSEMEGI